MPPSPPRQTELRLPIHAFRVGNNGLRVVLVPDPRASQIEVAMRYRVGAIDDPVGREGMAHLAEHVMFLPVTGPGHETLFARLEATASWFNGFTGLETTTYVSRGDPSRLADLLYIEALRLTIRCRSLTEAELVREREVVRNELRQRAEEHRIRAAVLEGLYPEHHAYRRPAASSEESVGRISREEVCAFIDAHYSPDNAVLTVSGNVTPEALDEALTKLLARIPKRPLAGHPAVAPLAPGLMAAREVPIRRPMGIVAWPLDADPAARAQVRAVAAMLALHIDAELASTVRVIELGELGARAIGFQIEPAWDQSVAQAVDAVKRIVHAEDMWIRPGAFEHARSRAGYDLFAQFEDGIRRAELFSEHVLAGRHPTDGLTVEIRALNRLTADSARDLMRERFSLSKARVVVLLPEPARRPPDALRAAEAVAVAPAAPGLDARSHRAGEPRVRVDPAAARVEATRTVVSDPLAGVRSRTLANGLRVILMPLASVPTIDVRLVFPVGAIDEPVLQRGVAYVAAHALEPNPQDVGVTRAAYRTGGIYSVLVGAEHTTFVMRGLAMYADVLLHRLDRWVRNGAYTERARDEVMRRALAREPRETPVQKGWLAALHGSAHPYAYLDGWRPARFAALELAALRRFHADHFRPGGATLIVAGGFEPAIVERWIDYLFADWSGERSDVRSVDRAHVRAVALAKHDERATQVAVMIALHAGGTRAARRIAARMINAAIADVRTQLGASYGLHATLVEQRLSSYIHIAGFVAAERAPEALALVREQIGRIGGGAGGGGGGEGGEEEASAASFVAARRDVMARLSSIPSGASALASLAVSAVELGDPVAAGLAFAEEARKLTLEQMDRTLRMIDLARGAILLSGPRDAVTRAFDALGRTPRVVVGR